MNHPNREDWVPYVFGEAQSAIRRQLKLHLDNCAECREQLESWRRSLGRLNAWRLPRWQNGAGLLAPSLKWALAAGLMICVGFGVGRLTAPRATIDQVRAAVEPGIRQQLSQELAGMVREQVSQAASATLAAAGAQTERLLVSYADSLEADRATDTEAIYATLDRLQKQRLEDYLALKRDLDTVAVNTDAGLRRTEQQLVQLADYSPAGH